MGYVTKSNQTKFNKAPVRKPKAPQATGSRSAAALLSASADAGMSQLTRTRDAAAFDAMCRPVSEGGQRPLKPPGARK